MSNWSKTAGASASAKSESQRMTRGNTVAQEREERQQCRDQEEQELHVQEPRVERAHRSKVDRLEGGQQQGIVEVREPVGRAGEDDRVGPAEGVERMTLERPDRPCVVAIQRRDPEGAPVIDDQRDQSGEPDRVDPVRPAPAWTFGAVQAPGAERERQSGHDNETDPAKARPARARGERRRSRRARGRRGRRGRIGRRAVATSARCRAVAACRARQRASARSRRASAAILIGTDSERRDPPARPGSRAGSRTPHTHERRRPW